MIENIVDSYIGIQVLTTEFNEIIISYNGNKQLVNQQPINKNISIKKICIISENNIAVLYMNNLLYICNMMGAIIESFDFNNKTNIHKVCNSYEFKSQITGKIILNIYNIRDELCMSINDILFVYNETQKKFELIEGIYLYKNIDRYYHYPTITSSSIQINNGLHIDRFSRIVVNEMSKCGIHINTKDEVCYNGKIITYKDIIDIFAQNGADHAFVCITLFDGVHIYISCSRNPIEIMPNLCNETCNCPLKEFYPLVKKPLYDDSLKLSNNHDLPSYFVSNFKPKWSFDVHKYVCNKKFIINIYHLIMCIKINNLTKCKNVLNIIIKDIYNYY